MTELSFDEVAGILPEPILLVRDDGGILSANPSARHVLCMPAGQIQARDLTDLVIDAPEKVRRYLKACARTRQMVLGSLTVRSPEDRAISYRSEGAVIRPWSAEAPALLLLRLSPMETASQQFTLLNKKIEELAKEVHVRQQAESRLAFLAEASADLGRTLNLDKTLQRVADLVVPRLADWCLVVLLKGDELAEVAGAHKDPDQTALVCELGRRSVLDPRMPFDVLRAIRTGQTVFRPDVPQPADAPHAPDDPPSLLHRLGLVSMMTVPMKHGQTQGALILVRSGSGRRYHPPDLTLAEELARRALTELDNAFLYREAEQARRKAEEMNRLKTSFLANMSHEIRTPLTSIIGLASLLVDSVTEENRVFAERITSGGRRLMDTLNAVLALAQLEANRVSIERDLVCVAEETRETVTLLERQAQKKGLTLHLSVIPEAETAMAYLDRGAFHSILQNIVGNAIKYTDNGHVMINVMHDADQIHVMVEDTGVGIDEAFLPHIFDPFRQESVGWGRSHEGTGLGLSITKRLVEHLDGTITVHSIKSQGSQFTIHFPLAADHRQGAGSTGPRHTPSDRAESKKKARILVVEDNPDTQLFLNALLQRVGTVHMASNADEALAEAQRYAGPTEVDDDAPPNPASIDLILMDINLGDGPNGVDVLKALRTMPRYHKVPIIAVTGYAMPGDRERLLAEGFDAYLAKPFEMAELLELIARFLNS